jgi:hypothetical protein
MDGNATPAQRNNRPSRRICFHAGLRADFTTPSLNIFPLIGSFFRRVAYNNEYLHRNTGGGLPGGKDLRLNDIIYLFYTPNIINVCN